AWRLLAPVFPMLFVAGMIEAFVSPHAPLEVRLAAVADVAGAIDPGDAVVAHVAGSLTLEVLLPHVRVGSIHPLMSLPNAEVGAERLRASCWFALAGGDTVLGDVVAALGGRSFAVPDEDRAVYHAAACVASNHLVALMGQVERLARSISVPQEAYLDLARQSLANVEALGAADALTGPAARGDDETIDRHLAHLPPDERASYEAMVEEARRLAGEG
ncbi:MAG: DUF2520 domain-containing protein, partial [Actinomycetota bacterium]